MKRIIAAVFIMMFISSLHAQEGNVGLKVTYEYKLPFTSSDFKIPLIKEVMKASQRLRFILLLNKNHSLFKKQEAMSIGESHYVKMASAFGDAMGAYYYNKKEGLLLRQRNSDGAQYLLTIDLNKYDWELQDETKTIAGYHCQLATAEKEVKNNVVIIKTEGKTTGPETVTLKAWFAPSLPNMFGPTHFVGLPGLVLMASIKGVSFKAISVEKVKNTDLQKPKGVSISEEEFNKKQVDNFRNLRGH